MSSCKTRDLPSESQMSEEQREAICYKSKLLNKYFDNYNEMVEAEDVYKKAHEQELAKKELRSKAAAEIEEAAKSYLELVEENKKIKSELAKKEQEAYDAYAKKLNEFAKDHQGYHLTYSYDGKNLEFKVEENRQNSLQEYIDSQNKLMHKFFENFWF